jgi:chromosome segregation protein
MYLKRLEINGFKSFAKKSELDFKTPITSIVGPNGSGKSNVAEAFRFVLGEQSIKSLRGKKGEDLIFNGGAEIPRANRAAVKVVFDNARRIFNIDFDEVTLERVVHRDGVNQYFINGTQVRLRDLVELLAQAHIGASGHHIISQGEADRVLSANPKERREMIEDALGLKVYQYKRLESERKLAKTEENIAQVEGLRREIAPHIKFLKKQVEKIEKAVELKGQLIALYKEYFKREETYLAYHKGKIEAEGRAPAQELAKLETDLQQAKKVLEDSSGEKKKQYEIVELEGKLKGARVQYENLSRDCGRIEGQIASLQRMVVRKEELAKADEHKTVLLREVEDVLRNVAAETATIDQISDLQRLREIVRKISSAFSGFIAKHRGETHVGTLEEKQEIENLQSEKKSLEKQIADIRESERILNERYLVLKQQIEKEKDSSRDAERAVFTIMTRQNELRSTLGAIAVQAEKIELEEQNFKRELGEGSAIVGRDILDYKNFVIENSANNSAPVAGLPETVVTEPRQMQDERRRTISRLQIRLEESGAGNSEEVLKEYRETNERDVFLIREIEDLQKSAGDLKKLIKELIERLNTEFKTGVSKINTQFGEFFKLMFGGGVAALEIVREEKKKTKNIGGDDGELSDLANLAEPTNGNEEKEPEEGIDVHVALPNKKTKGLMMLSGGERALTSIALLFAISQVNPPPFIILDETDAALDEANSRKYGDMIANLARYSQLILITHNRETMSRAGVLYGVTMGSGGASKLLSIQFDEAVQVAK